MKNFKKLLVLFLCVFGVISTSSCSFFNTVTEIELSGSVKHEYALNESFSANVKVTADSVVSTIQINVSKDGVLEKVNGYDFVVTGFDTTSAGDKTCIIKLDGSSISFSYTVIGSEATGSGTESNPYLVHTTAQFIDLQKEITLTTTTPVYAKLMANLNFYGVEYTPINVKNCPFVLNGNGKTISNLKISASNNTNSQGLFGEVSKNTTITSLIVDSFDILGYKNVGAIIGSSTGCNVTLNNVQVLNSSIRSTKWVGGLIGDAGNTKCEIVNCKISKTNVTAYSSTATDPSGIDLEIEDAKKAGALIGMTTNGTQSFDGVSFEDVNIAGCRDLGLLVGSCQTPSTKPVIKGEFHIDGNNTICATVTSGFTLGGSTQGVTYQASAGLLFGTLLVSSENSKKTVDNITIDSSFEILVNNVKVYFAANGSFSVGNQIENVVSISSTAQDYATDYNGQTFVRFVGAYRIGSEYYQPVLE